MFTCSVLVPRTTDVEQSVDFAEDLMKCRFQVSNEEENAKIYYCSILTKLQFISYVSCDEDSAN